MPIIIRLEMADGTEEMHHIPAEIWKMGDTEVTTAFITDSEVVQMTLDPYLETADTDVSNNYWPPRQAPTRFDIFKDQKQAERERGNPMQRSQK